MKFSEIRPIEKNGSFFSFREKHRVQLSDGVFAYEVYRPGHVSCEYCPIGNLSVSHRKRHDGRILIRGFGQFLIVLLVVVFSSLALDNVVGEEEHVVLDLLAYFALAVVVIAFLNAIVQTVRFCFRKRTTNFHVSVSEVEGEFEIWHAEGISPELDDIVESVEKDPSELRLSISPLIFDHDWSFTRPVSSAFWVVIGVVLGIYFSLGSLSALLRIIGVVIDEPPLYLLGFFVLAPGAGLVTYARLRYRLAHAEPGHSTALLHFINREYGLARRDCDAILDAQPDNFDALALAVHIRIQQGKLNEIAPFCERIDELYPEAGTELFDRVAQVWDLKPSVMMSG